MKLPVDELRRPAAGALKKAGASRADGVEIADALLDELRALARAKK